ncbi:Glyoxalase-like domain [Capnocytophaga sputigena]|uniref:Glyoxalase-like domain n=1 Tax=Capnocytophaga sputigena TaxID=1019 RepID=A0AAX2IAY7_CAPSP|nr:Glyoxalase-like domain [Capnocytophaga sputigena]
MLFLQQVCQSELPFLFYMDIEGIDEFHQQMKAKKLEITELKTTWYGMKEFYLKDINGYILGFAEKAEQ